MISIVATVHNLFIKKDNVFKKQGESQLYRLKNQSSGFTFWVDLSKTPLT